MTRYHKSSGVLLMAIAAASATVLLAALAGGAFEGAKFWSQEAAGWAASIATVGAILVALTASERERRHSLELQRRVEDHELRMQQQQWARDDVSARLRARALANVFHGELLDAAGDLLVLIRNISDGNIRTNLRDVREFLVHGDQAPRFQMMSRFADRLEGFETGDQFNILSALSQWAPFANNLPASFLEAPDDIIRQTAFRMRLQARDVIAMFANLQRSLENYMYEGVEVVIPAPRIELP